MQSQDSVVGTGRLLLEPTLNMAAASPLAQQLLAARGSDLQVDASQVQHIGAQCMQVLAAASRTWQADGARFAVADASPAFEDGTRLLGLASFFSLAEGR